MFNNADNAGKEPLLALYRHRVLRHHRLVPPPPAHAPPITAHRVLLVRKQGRRGIANFEEVLRYVRGGCAGACAGVPAERTLPVAFHTMSVREQVHPQCTATPCA